LPRIISGTSGNDIEFSILGARFDMAKSGTASIGRSVADIVLVSKLLMDLIIDHLKCQPFCYLKHLSVQ